MSQLVTEQRLELSGVLKNWLIVVMVAVMMVAVKGTTNTNQPIG